MPATVASVTFPSGDGLYAVCYKPSGGAWTRVLTEGATGNEGNVQILVPVGDPAQPLGPPTAPPTKSRKGGVGSGLAALALALKNPSSPS